MPDVVVHGASGFIGKHFVEKLISKKVPVVILSRSSSDISSFEDQPLVKVLRYRDNLSELNIGEIRISEPVFFEFSWYGVFGSERNKQEQLTLNIPLLTSSVNFAGEIKSKHWVGIGSQAEYGPYNKIISESDECKPTTLYGEAKLICCKKAMELCQKFNMEFSWLRLFSVYGPDDNHEWLIQYLIKEMLYGRDVNVTEGEQCWDYLYIDDVTEALEKLIGSTGVNIANLGSGKAIKVKYIIEKIKEITRSKSKINFGIIPYRSDQVMFMEANIEKLSTLLNWRPKINLDEGLRITIDKFITN